MTIKRQGDLKEGAGLLNKPLDSISPGMLPMVQLVAERMEEKRGRETPTGIDPNAGLVRHLIVHAQELQMPAPEYRVPATRIPRLHSCNFLSRVGATTFRSNGQMKLEDCPCGSVRRCAQYEGDFPSYWEGKNSRRKES